MKDAARICGSAFFKPGKLRAHSLIRASMGRKNKHKTQIGLKSKEKNQLSLGSLAVNATLLAGPNSAALFIGPSGPKNDGSDTQLAFGAGKLELALISWPLKQSLKALTRARVCGFSGSDSTVKSHTCTCTRPETSTLPEVHAEASAAFRDSVWSAGVRLQPTGSPHTHKHTLTMTFSSIYHLADTSMSTSNKRALVC